MRHRSPPIYNVRNPMGIRIHNRIADIPAAAWDALHDGGNPFVRHAFLDTLERCGAAAEDNGWSPHHLAMYDNGRLVGAVPLFRKSNSWGEFVFDWTWAEAFHRAGLSYFPKLVAGVPFTPVTGPRLLAGSGPGARYRRRQLVDALIKELERLGDSTLHVNFVNGSDAEVLSKAGLLARRDVQFHWRNDGYRSFGDFLAALNHKRRKNIRRERRSVAEAGIVFDWIAGSEAREWHWVAMHGFYVETFLRHLNRPVLDLDCFRALGKKLGDTVLMILARRDDRYVGGALLLRGRDALFGRYWGCREHHDHLHFETCYYQGIEYCIREGLDRFEPGAQGEYKLLRGFEPVFTQSFHWVRDPRFRTAIARALCEERALVCSHRDTLAGHVHLKR